MEGFHHHMNISSGVVNMDMSGAGGGGGGGDRFPQWSMQETKEFLMIRSELDRNFMETKRNKLLWEVTSNKMKEKGRVRSADQCKCKWKNLVTRYKGCETMEVEVVRQQFPFFDEMQTIFATRMQRMLWSEAEGGASGSTQKSLHLSSDEDEESDQEEKSNTKKKRKISNTNRSSASTSGSNNNVREILEEFMKQQLQIEMQWREMFEVREKERMMREMEWRQTMEALENERLMMDRRWREKEEERRVRDEIRAEKRDALINALINKLTRDSDKM